MRILAVCVCLIWTTCSASAQSASEHDVLSPLVVSVIAPPNPVLGADDDEHLAYEIMVVNQSPAAVTIESVETLDPAGPQGGSDAGWPRTEQGGGLLLDRLSGATLEAVLRHNAGGKGALLAAGSSATLFMDTAIPTGVTLPRALEHRFDLSLVLPAAALPTTEGDLDPASLAPIELSFVGGPTSVGQEPAVVIGPPLRGSRWVAANGCCATITSHRGAVLSINGAPHVPERFAIDFVQLDAEGRVFQGPIDALSSYAFFGAEILSVADGVVVGSENKLSEQVPGKLPPDTTIQNAGGNHVVVDIGGGRFAFYAHMQPGSLRVKVGDRVQRGQVLGLLGNSGNTDAPHLHFHVMDGPRPLRSNGLPYVLSSFTGEGVVKDVDDLEKPEVAPVDRDALSGEHRDQLPLDLEVLTFP